MSLRVPKALDDNDTKEISWGRGRKKPFRPKGSGMMRENKSQIKRLENKRSTPRDARAAI
jgi:hypothetical protein